MLQKILAGFIITLVASITVFVLYKVVIAP